jgi:hypothetical protein
MRLYLCLVLLLVSASFCVAQELPQTKDVTAPAYKNVIRYNLSGALLFGVSKYFVLGYERVVNANQSFSINAGIVALPKLIQISTADFKLESDQKNTGFNISGDYRFYLKKENRYLPPHGLYIGPYYSYNHFKRENYWVYSGPATGDNVDTRSDLNIHTVGFELGYQFVLWKRMTIDMVMMGPGVGFYNYKATIDSVVPAGDREQLLQGLAQLLTQRFPGMNYVYADGKFSADGKMRTSAAGFRYIVHVGFRF